MTERGEFASGTRSSIDLRPEKPGCDEAHVKAACLALFRFLDLRHLSTEKRSRSFSLAVSV